MFKSLLVIFEGLKSLRKVLELITGLYTKWKDSQIDKHYEEKKRRVGDLTRQLEVESEKESPDEQALRDLHNRLRNLGMQ